MEIQWNLSNPDTNGAEGSGVICEVSSFQSVQEWYLYWEKVSCLEVSSGDCLAVSRLCKHPSCDCICVYTSKLNALLRVGK